MQTRLTQTLWIIAGLLMACAVQAELLATGDDGREVRLNDDGRWEYTSTDRFANTVDGRRIRLQEDGRWEYIGNQPIIAEQQYRNNTIDVSLLRVEILEFKEPATGNRKSSRLTTKTNFYFTVTASAIGETIYPRLRNNQGEISGFTVSDDRGKHYSIIELTPEDTVQLPPGEAITYQLQITASPKWGPETIQLIIDKEVFSTNEAITLTAMVKDIEHISGK